ncbi:MAG: hypothetical protein N3G21_01425 [Candidatus Hydrogenedentes bacterium]|nr:hypothetical protein [Candidatus Hydrogenedentota bacterium]
MRNSKNRIKICFILTFVLVIFVARSYAFFPSGGFDQFNVLRLARWPFYDLDTNNDGKITAGEGVGVYIEEGKRGFKPEEIEDIKFAIEVWNSVPTSYASVRISGYYQDPLSLTIPDALPTISMYVTEADVTDETIEADPESVDVGGGILAVTITLFTVTDTLYEANGQIFPISAGTIVDRDVVVSATAHRTGVEDTGIVANLKGTLVHELGHFLGLDHTPLNNLRAVYLTPTDEIPAYLVENEVVWMTLPNGVAKYVGATPTMFPIYFEVELPNGTREDGCKDLAPDDISGISWLYPRGAQENFFDIRHEARSRTRRGSGIPSIPLPGGHVVAWADVDNYGYTTRVPLFSTMVGLYEPLINKQLQGKFNLIGLWKTMEVPGKQAEVFTPTYTITLSPMNGTGLERQAPPGMPPSFVDSIQGPNSYSVSTRAESDYQVSFMSEVFHEVENIIDVSKKDAGTPLVWSFVKNTVVSAVSDKTLPQMRPYLKPMFGDPNDVCPLNVIEVGTGTGEGGTTTPTTPTEGSISIAQDIRRFRDTFLMNSNLGLVLVDIYYAVAPLIAKAMLKDELVMRLVTSLVRTTLSSKMLVYIGVFLLAVISFLIVINRSALKMIRREYKMLGKDTGKKISIIFLFISLGILPSASARIAYLTTEQLVEASDAVVSGEIVATNSYMAKNMKIYTEVEILIKETVKGDLNEGSSLVFTILGGEKDGFVMVCSEMPVFKVGDEVILYLRYLPKTQKWTLYAGTRSVTSVKTDESSGKKYVMPYSEIDMIYFNQDKNTLKKLNGGSSVIPNQKSEIGIEFDSYLRYLKGFVK